MLVLYPLPLMLQAPFMQFSWYQRLPSNTLARPFLPIFFFHRW